MKIIYRSKLGCRIIPYKKRLSPILEKNTSIYDRVYHKWIEYAGFCLPYKGEISYATYCRSYSDLKRMLPDYEIKNMPLIKSNKFSKSIQLQNVEAFWEAQTEIIGKIESSLGKENVWFINLQTGQGKTLLTTYLSTVLGYKTWILCFSDDILVQWGNTYQQKTNIDPTKILRVTGSIIDKILADKIDPSDYDVFMCTPTLLDRFGNRRSDYSKIADLFNKCGIGLLVYDEAHRNVGNLVKLSAVTNVRYQIYLSADFGQGDYEKDLIYKEIFKNVNVLTPSEDLQISMKYTKLIVVNYNTYPNSIEENEPFSRYGYNPELYMKYEFKKGIIKDAIFYTLESILKTEDKYRILILFTNIVHVNEMYYFIKEKYPNLNIGRFYSELDSTEKENAKNNSKIIVATYGSFSTGLDAKDIKYVLSTNQCNKVMDNQSAGRARPLSDGSDAMYFMFVDNGFSYCKRKLKIRLSYLTKTKAKDECPYSFTYHPDIYKECNNNE